MKKRHVWQLVFIASWAVGGCTAPRPAVPMVIGHVAPRSGSLRAQGLAAEAAIRLAVNEAKAAENQVAGRPVEVRHPDSEGDAATAQSVAVRLLTISHVSAMIGGSDPASAERLCRVAQQYKVPLLTPTWLPPAQLGPYGFCVGLQPADQGQALARCAIERIGAERITVLTDARSAAGLALAAAFVEAADCCAVVRQVEYATEDDFLILAREVAAEETSAILLAGRVAELEKLRAQLLQAKPHHDAPLALLFGGADDPRLPGLGDLWAGMHTLYWTTAYAPDARSPPAEEFARKFEESTQRPPDAAAVLAYDSARILFEALRQARTTRGDKIRDELLKLMDFETLAGPLTFDKNQMLARPVHVVYREGERLHSIRP
jgi:branched-chain amino acid transport system substrate-binding protein